MLQQTRVAAVIPYYSRFLKQFPTIAALAAAEEETLLKAWAGLGYYRRVRQMQQAAQQIVTEYGGVFPCELESIRSLAGVGPYTAGAIASIAFGQPTAAVDGNVIRVVTRLLDDSRLSSSTALRTDVEKTVQHWVESAGPGDPSRSFTQAMMELGATVCTPRNPTCLLCPLTQLCEARRVGTVDERPVRPAKGPAIEQDLWVALAQRDDRVLMRQRPADASIMPGFWELPERKATSLDKQCFADENIALEQQLGTFSHGITKYRYRGIVWAAKLAIRVKKAFHWVNAEELNDLPVTTVTKKALSAAHFRQTGENSSSRPLTIRS